MPRSPLRHLLAGTLVAALALGGVAACSSDDDAGGGTPEATFGDLIGLIPDTPANHENVLVQRYDVAEAGAEPWKAEGSEEDRELTRLAKLGMQTGIEAPAVVGGAVRTQELMGTLGFVPSDVTAAISAGLPPDATEVSLVDTDEDAALDAAADAVDGATREDVDGTDVVRWLDDSRIERGVESPVGALPGQAARLAWTAPGALAYATTDDAMAAAVGADDGGTLADLDAFRAVAAGLDDADAYAAYLTDVPIVATPGPRATPEQVEAFEGGTLEPYTAIGVGSAWGDDGLELVIVLAHDDEDAAEANAAALTAAVAEGTSYRTGQPWSQLLTDPDVEQEGSTVVGRFSVESPGLWQQLVVSQEPLLAVG